MPSVEPDAKSYLDSDSESEPESIPAIVRDEPSDSARSSRPAHRIRRRSVTIGLEPHPDSSSSEDSSSDDRRDLFSDTDDEPDEDEPIGKSSSSSSSSSSNNTTGSNSSSSNLHRNNQPRRNLRKEQFNMQIAEMYRHCDSDPGSNHGYSAGRRDYFDTPDYEPVVVTEDEKTKFPEDFFGPNGLSNYEYSSVVTQHRNAGKRSRGNYSDLFSDYDGHHSRKYARVAGDLRVPMQVQGAIAARQRLYDETLTSKSGYIKPGSNWAKMKYARYLIRTETRMPEKIPFVFFPHSHSYEYNVRNKRLENVVVGTLEDGHSCTIRATGFRPYCYLEIPDEMTKLPGGKNRTAGSLRKILTGYLEHMEKALRSQLAGNYLLQQLNESKGLINLQPTIQNHINSRLYHGDNPKPFLKIYAEHPKLIPIIKKLAQRPFGALPGDTYESGDEVGWLPKEEFAGYGMPEIATVCDAHVDYTVRFLADLGLKASGAWFVFNHHSIQAVQTQDRISHSNLEIVTHYKNLRSASDLFNEKHRANVIDCKFDIEVETNKTFPRPETNAVTQIVLRLRFGPLGTVKVEDSSLKVNTPMKPGETIRKPGFAINICLCLKSTEAFKDFDVHVFNDERDLLMAFHELMIMLQPDFMCGHFSDNFDWDYLLERARILGLTAFPFFSRLFRKPATNDVRKQKAKKGMLRGNTHVAGMVVWDSLKWAKDMTFEKTLSLNALAEKKLGSKKIDVGYSLIGGLMKSEKGRTLLCEYCNYDVVLLEKLDDKMTSLKQLHEMSNLCNIPIQLLGDRASTFRMLGLWLFYTQRFYNLSFPDKKLKGPAADPVIPSGLGAWPGPDSLKDGRSEYFFHDRHVSEIFFLTPSPDSFRPPKNQDPYGGGCVFEPISGFYAIPNSTLDFTSLYPSIMRAFNLGFMTMIPAGKQKFFCDALGLDINKDLWHEPVFLLEYGKRTTRPYIDMNRNPSYVRPHVMLSLIRYIESYVLGARKAAKGSMGEYFDLAREETDPDKKAAYLFLAGKYNVYQMVLKVICNGMYGALGMSGGAFTLRPCAKTITNMARQSLEHTRYFVFRTVRKCNGWGFNVVITYGDTDSVFPLAIDPGDDTPIREITFPTPMEARLFLFDNFEKVCELVNETLPEEMNLDFEKTSERSYHCTPKCYVLRMCEGKKKDYFTMAKGLSYVRRGGCAFQRTTCKRIIDALMEHGDLRGAIQIGREAVRRVLAGELTQKEILMRSSLSQEIEEYKGTKPPHVAMAEKIYKRTGTKLRAGDRVYYIVTPSFPKAKVTDRVEGPEEYAKNGLSYDRAYYLDLILKECKKLLRALVNPDTFRDRFMFSEWVRITKHMPDGEKEIAKAKAEKKKQLDKIVESVILWGREVEFDNSPKSLDELPEEYQGQLFEPDWHWAGWNSEERVPHVSEWNPPWIKTPEDREKVLGSLSEDLECTNSDDGDNADDDSEDEGLAFDIEKLAEDDDGQPESEQDSGKPDDKGKGPEKESGKWFFQASRRDSDDDDSDLDDEDDNGFFGRIDVGEDECTEEEEKLLRRSMNIVKRRPRSVFARSFVSEKNDRKKYLSTIIGEDYLRNVKHGSIPVTSPLYTFVEKQIPCVRCKKIVSEKYLGLCRNCETIIGNAEPRNEYVAHLEDLEQIAANACKTTMDVCIRCVSDRYRAADAASRDLLIADCSEFLCDDWPARLGAPTAHRKAVSNLERAQRYRSRLDIEYELEQEGMIPARPVADEDDGLGGFNSGKSKTGEDLKRKRKEKLLEQKKAKRMKKDLRDRNRVAGRWKMAGKGSKKMHAFFQQEVSGQSVPGDDVVSSSSPEED